MSKPTENISGLVDAITKDFTLGKFKHYIEYIRFPFYKNLEVNSRINFDFPFTVLIGPNGSGKSSALHAIYGAPEGYSTGIFWFATKVDPIIDEKNNRPGFVYGYKNESEGVVEVVKTRIGTAKGGHYWEPSRPLVKWHMKKAGTDRNPTIVKPVYYLDFRAELSAYDKFFYFSNFKATKTIKTKQDAVRKKSTHLRSSIDQNKPGRYFKRKIKQPILLDKIELEEVNRILGKNYVECKLIHHNLYSENEGLTIYFKTAVIGYSEAFAGRGEYAIVKLVHEIIQTPDYSLVLLDEPEVSLHPGAQEKLLEFLLKQTLRKHLQVIISTHSPKFVSFLPENALKLFYPATETSFGIKNQCHFLEAFEAIGHDLSVTDKKVIYVEDYLAKALVEKVIESEGTEWRLLFDVRFNPGGADHLLTKASSFIQDGENNKFIILDGDKQLIMNWNYNQLSLEESKSITSLEIKIKELTGINFSSLKFGIDGSKSTGTNKEQRINYALKYLEFLSSKLEYLPNNKVPEDIIWDKEYALQLVGDSDKFVEHEQDNKTNLKNFTEKFFKQFNENTYRASETLFLNNFISKKNHHYLAILETLRKFRFS